MPNRYWVNDGADNSWWNANNWSATDGGVGGAGVPTFFDDVYFTSSCIDHCIIDSPGGDTYAKSITATSGYTGPAADDGHLDAVTDDADSVNALGNVILDNKQVSLGRAMWTIGGDFDYKDLVTLNEGTSLVMMTENGTSIIGNTNKKLNDLEIRGNATLSTASSTGVRVDGTLTVKANRTLSIGNARWMEVRGECKVETGATITDEINSGELRIQGADILQMDGTIDCRTLTFYQSPGSILATTYDSPQVEMWAGWTPQSGTYIFNCSDYFRFRNSSFYDLVFHGTNNPTLIFNGDVEFRDYVAKDLIIDCAGHTVNWDFHGDVKISATGSGDVIWLKGNGTITFSGSDNQDVDLDDHDLEDVEVDKSGGTITFTGGWTAGSFHGTQGTIDFNGQAVETTGNLSIGLGAQINGSGLDGSSITVGGNCTLTGEDGDLLDLAAGASWDLTVSGTATASWVDVAYSDASGGSMVVPPRCVDSGNNINWAFAVGGPYRAAVGEVFHSGAEAGQRYLTGAAAGQDFVATQVAGQICG